MIKTQVTKQQRITNHVMHPLIAIKHVLWVFKERKYKNMLVHGVIWTWTFWA